jgi:regulator of protease activity HflC (stomatin/prohibitin superfamily)
MEFLAIPAAIVVFWAFLGIYQLRPQQSALLMRFSKPVGSSDEAGLHWRPLGIVSVTKVPHAIQEFAFKEVVFTKQEVEIAGAGAGATDGKNTTQPASSKQTALASVTVEGVVQYSIMQGLDNLIKAKFKLADPQAMIKQRFQNALRGTMNVRTMWAALSDKDKAAQEVQTDLTHVAEEFGHTINNISITNVTPANAIVDANDRLVASVAEMQTRANKGEGEKQETFRIAQGKALAMIENGRGIAGERDAIVKGWEQAVEELKKAWPEAQALDVMAMILFQNYLDAMVKLAASGNNKVIFSNSAVSGASDLLAQLRQSLIASGEATATSAPPASTSPARPE